MLFCRTASGGRARRRRGRRRRQVGNNLGDPYTFPRTRSPFRQQCFDGGKEPVFVDDRLCDVIVESRFEKFFPVARHRMSREGRSEERRVGKEGSGEGWR